MFSRHSTGLWLKLVRDLPCRILGDPLQAIFDFEEESPVDWDTEIPGNFEPLGQLDTPHRWLQAGQAGLGAWLQTIRSALEDGRSIDLTQRADGITFRYAVDDEALLIAQGNVCRYFDCERQHLVIAIHKGHQQYKAKCHRLARNIGGRFSSIEEIEGRDLFSFINQVERARANQVRLKKLIAFARRCMTAVGASLTAATSRGEHTPIRGNTRNPGRHHRSERLSCRSLQREHGWLPHFAEGVVRRSSHPRRSVQPHDWCPAENTSCIRSSR